MPLLLVLVAGVLIRVVVFLRRDALFIDEAMLAHTIATRSWADLTPPFTYQQVAPPGVLWLAKLMTDLFGMGEYSLRIGSLLAGVAALVVFASVARRVLPRYPAAIAVALMGLSPAFVRYSDEFKQYGFDVLAAVLVFAATARLVAESTPANRRWWIAAGGFAILISTAAPLILGAAWIGALMLGSVGGHRALLGIAAVVWGGLQGAVLIGYYGDSDTPYLRHYWASHFLDPTAPHFTTRLKDAIDIADSVAFRIPVPIPTAIVVAILVALTAPYWFSRSRRILGVAALGPIVLCGLASMVNRYPIVERTGLFTLPALALILAGAVATLTDSDRRPQIRWAGYGLGLLALVGPAAALVSWGRGVPQAASARLAIERVQTEPRLPLYVEIRAMPEYLFYSTDWSHPDRARLDRLGAVIDRVGPNAGNNPPRDRKVEAEGDSLVFDDGGRPLLVGIPTGMQLLGGTGVLSIPNPDTGWADNEARRMAARGRGPALLLLTRLRKAGTEALFEAVHARGGTIDTSFADRAVRLLRVRWDSAAPSSDSADAAISHGAAPHH